MRQIIGLLFMTCMQVCANIDTLQNQEPDSSGSDTSVMTITDTMAYTKPDSQHVHNPLIAGGASALLPGLGQIYTKRYVKGGLFFATETILGLVTRDRYFVYSKDKENNIDKWSDSIANANQLLSDLNDSLLYYEQQINSTAITDSQYTLDSIRYSEFTDSVSEASLRVTSALMNYDLARYDRREAEKVFYHLVCGLTGLTYFNIMDALQSSGYFINDKSKKPALAGWLSAIPGLGIGQIYNGSLTKAGMISMVQITMGFVAYNNHNLMRDCEEKILEMSDPNSDKHALESTFRKKWDDRRDEAFRKRNTFLWYSILFYFYGIFDAVVDAHLHDSKVRMRLEPDLVLSSDQVGFSLRCLF